MTLLQAILQHRSIHLIQQVGLNLHDEVRANTENVAVVGSVMDLAQRQAITHRSQPAFMAVRDDVRRVQQLRVCQRADCTTRSVRSHDRRAKHGLVNTLLGLGMQGIAEALALGSRLDLPRDLLYSTLAKTAVVPPALVGKLAAAGRRDYTPQFPLRLMHKDFGLIISAAEKSGLFMPATESAAAVNAAEAASGPEQDFSAVIRLMEERFALETISTATH